MRFTTPILLLSASLAIAAPVAQAPAPAAVTPPSFNDINQATKAKILQESQKVEAAKEKKIQQGGSSFNSILGGGGIIPKRALTHTKRQVGGGFLSPLSAVESLFGGVGGGKPSNGGQPFVVPGRDFGKGIGRLNPASAPAPAQQ